jgi:hypothetical protein
MSHYIVIVLIYRAWYLIERKNGRENVGEGIERLNAARKPFRKDRCSKAIAILGDKQDIALEQLLQGQARRHLVEAALSLDIGGVCLSQRVHGVQAEPLLAVGTLPQILEIVVAPPLENLFYSGLDIW